jgi:hypothetical protein
MTFFSQSFSLVLFMRVTALANSLLRMIETFFDWRKIIKRSSFHFSDTRAGYVLPYSKTDRFYQGTHILFVSQAVADPVFSLRAYVVRRDAFHGAKPALFIRRDGSLPTRSWFDAKFFSLLDRSFGGHSPRAGGATFYSSLGLSKDVIQAIGRWTSQSWKIYIRDNPTVRAELQLAALRACRSRLSPLLSHSPFFSPPPSPSHNIFSPYSLSLDRNSSGSA